MQSERSTGASREPALAMRKLLPNLHERASLADMMASRSGAALGG
jgi:hypothetical protein